MEQPDARAATIVFIDDVPATTIGPGIVRRQLPATTFATAWAIDFEPGSVWPEIDHHQTEERYFVQSGEIVEGDTRHGTGTYVVFPAGSHHRPRSDTGARIIGLNELAK